MRVSSSSRLFVAVVLVALTAFACNLSNPTVTPAIPLPTLALSTPVPTISPVTRVPQTAAISATSPATRDLLLSPTPTSVIPLACPPSGEPSPPDRPSTLDDYPGTIAGFFSAGANAEQVQRLLKGWGAITDEAGAVLSLEMTGDIDLETVVALVDPSPEVDLPWLPGDVLIFQCRGGAVVPVYVGRRAAGEEAGDLQFSLEKVEDVNGTGRADVVYTVSSCGAHTCWGRLYIIEWDGAGFVNRIPDMEDYAYPTFTVVDGRVQVDTGGIGSAGAGHQRSYQEIWTWNGRQFSRSDQIVGSPTALVHYIHDGDEALVRGDYGEAITHYQQALEDDSLPGGTFLETDEQSVGVVRAYARFKLLVAYAVSGDLWRAQKQYDLLLAENPGGSSGSAYVIMGQAFWSDFLTNEAPASACAAAISIAEGNPILAEQLYAGYANPEYEPADLCRVGR